jgi:deoxyribonuclease V
MNACLDVDYRENFAVAACILFDDWLSADTRGTFTEKITPVHPYVPGQFFKRELPCLLKVLGNVQVTLETIIVDGFIWLGNELKPGLGAHLYEALSRRIAVIGVAKNRYVGASPVRTVFRGSSGKPLFVSAVGIGLEEAAAYVKKMHGSHRLPTLLKEVDRLCRSISGSPNGVE